MSLFDSIKKHYNHGLFGFPGAHATPNSPPIALLVGAVSKGKDMKDQTIELPPLFLPGASGGYTKEEMQLYAREAVEAYQQGGNAKHQYEKAIKGSEELDPIERLRFFCSIAMRAQDWLDVEPFFDALIADRQRRGEPVGYIAQNAIDWITAPERSVSANMHFAIYKTPTEQEIVAIYTAPQPAAPVVKESLTAVEPALPSEAIYAFAAWLTCRKQVTVFGSSQDASQAAELVREFVQGQGFEQPREHFPYMIKPYPSEQPAEPVKVPSDGRWPDPLSDFREGQWWVSELDAMKDRPGTTLDQKRAVAVVHHLIASVARYGQPAQPVFFGLDLASGPDETVHWDGISPPSTQPAASAEPLCWTVLGTTYPRNWTHFGQDAERSAKLDARNLGDESRAVPLYPAPVAAQPSVPRGLIAALRNQRQIDEDGSEVAVSRQAVDEAADLLDKYGVRVDTTPPSDGLPSHVERAISSYGYANRHPENVDRIAQAYAELVASIAARPSADGQTQEDDRGYLQPITAGQIQEIRDAALKLLESNASRLAQPDPAMAGDSFLNCDDDVFKNGVSVGLFDIPKERAEALCKALTATLGIKIDWHYIAGRVHIKALRVQPASGEDARDAARYRWLRDQNASLELNTFYVGIHREGDEPAWIGSDLDEAVDAAMQQEGQS